MPIAKDRSRYGAEQRAVRNAQSKAWRAKDPEKARAAVRKNALKSKFGLTPEQYNTMLAEQQGVCAICGGTNGVRRLAVDHDHETKKVRALLCGTCNIGLGSFKDNPILLRQAAEYLKRHK